MPKIMGLLQVKPELGIIAQTAPQPHRHLWRDAALTRQNIHQHLARNAYMTRESRF